MPALLDAFAQGTHAARPAATPANAGYYYQETDTDGGTLFQSTGSAWVQLAPGVSGSAPLTVQGGVHADTTLTQGQLLVVVTATGHTITLPVAAAHAGEQIVILVDDPVKSFTIAVQGGEPLPGYWANPGLNVHFISDGTQWWGMD